MKSGRGKTREFSSTADSGGLSSLEAANIESLAVNSSVSRRFYQRRSSLFLLMSGAIGAHVGFQLCWEFGPGVDVGAGKYRD
jgi:hypothetical protein